MFNLDILQKQIDLISKTTSNKNEKEEKELENRFSVCLLFIEEGNFSRKNTL